MVPRGVVLLPNPSHSESLPLAGRRRATAGGGDRPGPHAERAPHLEATSADPHAGDPVRTRTVAGNGTAISRDTEVIFTQPAAASITTVTGERIAVDYASRTWADVKGVPLTPQGAGPTPETIRAYIAAGQYRVVGRVELDGRPAIELVRTYTGGKDRDQRLWVDPGTYLPLRAVTTQTGVRVQADYEFLPPTEANLANLRPVIPPGFTQTATLPFK
jgi:hypothetical protein